MYVLPADLDIEGILPETAALALPAYRPAGKPAQKIFVLDFILVGLYPLEEFIDSDE